ncbi:MAG: 1-acyl-sn-glycerol-3-phosphate acyltransferase [Pseudomonadales bacterium]
MALLGRFINKLFVRAKVVGDVHISRRSNVVYVLENGRSEHRELLTSVLQMQGVDLLCRQLLSCDRKNQKALLYRLESLVERLPFAEDSYDIELVPVSIYHGHLPNRNFSWWRFLLAEREGVTSWWGRLVQLVFNGRQTLVQLDKPLSLRAMLKRDSQQPSGAQAGKVLQQLQGHFEQRRAATFGPVLQPRKRLVASLIDSADVQRAIESAAAEEGVPRAQVERRARRELRNMAANLSPSVARMIGLGLGRFYRSVYRQVRIEGLEQVRQRAKTHQMVYLPCHRSHMDYLLVSWSLHDQGLMLPYVVAGDNLNAPILGGVLRRGGAIFMRRSFKDDALYRALFRAYMMKMHSAGHALEYFIEGGRSRTGRLLPPKLGVLSLTVEAAMRQAEKPVALVPVWIGYDKLTESASYRKQLSGGEKRGESLFGLLQSLRLFKGKHGDAVVSYAAPIDLSTQLSKFDDPHVRSKAVAQQVMCAINAVSHVSETALIATVILTQPRQRIAVTALVEQVNQLSTLLLSAPQKPSSMAKGAVANWLQDAQLRGQVSRSGEDVYLTAEQAAEMTFYRNQIHHLTLFAGIYLLFAKRTGGVSQRVVVSMMQSVYPHLARSLFWPWEAQALPQVLEQLRQLLIAQQYIDCKGRSMQVRSTPVSVVLMQTAEPFLLRYYIVFRLLQRFAVIAQSDLIDECVRIAGELHLEFGFNSPEYTDPKTIHSFVRNLLDAEVLAKEGGMLRLAVDITPLLKRSRKMLLAQYLRKIDASLAAH